MKLKKRTGSSRLSGIRIKIKPPKPTRNLKKSTKRMQSYLIPKSAKHTISSVTRHFPPEGDPATPDSRGRLAEAGRGHSPTITLRQAADLPSVLREEKTLSTRLRFLSNFSVADSEAVRRGPGGRYTN